MFVADTTFFFVEYRSVTGAPVDQSGFVQHDQTGIQDQSKSDIEQIPWDTKTRWDYCTMNADNYERC